MLNEKTTVAKNIKKLRNQPNLSKNKLAKIAKPSYNTIIKIDSYAIKNPRMGTTSKIAKALS